MMYNYDYYYLNEDKWILCRFLKTTCYVPCHRSAAPAKAAEFWILLLKQGKDCHYIHVPQSTTLYVRN